MVCITYNLAKALDISLHECNQGVLKNQVCTEEKILHDNITLEGQGL
jgi:hypothetical protein